MPVEKMLPRVALLATGGTIAGAGAQVHKINSYWSAGFNVLSGLFRCPTA